MLVAGSGELTLLWDSHREGLGQSVEITSDLLQLLIFVTPAGTMDAGVVQPAYINFDAALLRHPTADLQAWQRLWALMCECLHTAGSTTCMIFAASQTSARSEFFILQHGHFPGCACMLEEH